MISYKIPEEKEMILKYAVLLSDTLTEEIINREEIRNKDEAIHLAEFYWKMVDLSNEEDAKTGDNSENILEKIIITLMAFFRSSGYEQEWNEICDKA